MQGAHIGYKILVVRGLVRLIALAMRLTGGQEIASKIHQHFIPGLVTGHFAKNLTEVSIYYADI
jgi:hypothetical protein